MPRKVRVKLISRGMNDLLRDPGVADDLRTRADRVLAAAEAGAPVHSGDYKDSLEVRMVEHDNRPVAQVHAAAPYAHIVEARTDNLARSLDAGLT
jgi:hypothetical protein